ncbi:MAG: hypothetical protein H0V41_07665 [Pseudonocardiales bacterium]|nr:hypothetical protein [Pseudonocardiales bacterium]
MDRVEIERKIMSEMVIEKTWEIPAYGGKGPVTVALRMPEGDDHRFAGAGTS